eukprot:TRINITY_DN3352_c0_g1_i1.p1 TRINITY_DN3352_c0_g1~~TRINITY_DN3352_c0_g1_i1.p1  ORF type:complete len:504 (+),score=112.18 TRINITY_DN3352_c0_g1_i1:52-1563(+)
MALFKRPLEEVVANDRQRTPSRTIPTFLVNAFKFLVQYGGDVEGIFRLAGSKEKVRQMRASLDRGDEPVFTPANTDPVDLADLVKVFFRELPDSLLMCSKYSEWIRITTIPEDEVRIAQTRDMLMTLPPVNVRVFCALIRFLRRLSYNAAKNKMGPDNMGLVFAPNLLWNDNQGNVDMMELMAITSRLREFVALIVNNMAEALPDVELDEEGIESATLICKAVGHVKSVLGLAWDDKAEQVWSLSGNGQIVIFDPTTCGQVGSVDTGAPRLSMNRAEGNLWLGGDRAVVAWDIATKAQVHSMPGFGINFLTVEGHTWIGGEGGIRVVALDTFECIQTIEIPRALVLCMEYVSDLRQVWVGGTGGILYIYNVDTGEVASQLTSETRRNLTCMAYHADTRSMWVGSEDRTIYVWNVDEPAIQARLTDDSMLMLNALVAVGNDIWSCSRDSAVRVWDAAGRSKKTKIEDFHTDGVATIMHIYSENLGWRGYTGSLDRSVGMWALPG